MQLDSVERFFKYSDVEGARFMLRDGTLKFSTATKFNDPFDSAIETLFGTRPEVERELVKLAYSKNRKVRVFKMERSKSSHELYPIEKELRYFL